MNHDMNDFMLRCTIVLMLSLTMTGPCSSILTRSRHTSTSINGALYRWLR